MNQSQWNCINKFRRYQTSAKLYKVMYLYKQGSKENQQQRDVQKSTRIKSNTNKQKPDNCQNNVSNGPK